MSKVTSSARLMSKKRSLLKRNKHLKNTCLEQLNLDAAGIDIGSRSHFVAVPNDRSETPVREFQTFTDDLKELVRWLKACQITTIAMESTGVYWIPVYEMLEAAGFEILLVDARHTKNVSGRKSDVLDCQWLQQLHTYGLLRGAFIPELEIKALRSYVGQRDLLIKESSRFVLRMQKALMQMNLQLHHVLSDITGVTGMAIIRAILAGERDPLILAKHRKKGCRNDIRTIAKALTGHYREEHLFTLRQAVELYDIYHEKIRCCDQQIEKRLKHLEQGPPESADGTVKTKKVKSRKHMFTFDAKGALVKMLGVDLTSIPSIEASTALTVISIIGQDMCRWKTCKHFTSWLGLAPGTKISGGKRLSGSTKPSSNRAASALRIAARTLYHSKTALGAYHRRLKARLGPPKAITASARKLAEIIYTMIKYKISFEESGQDYYEQRYRTRVIKNLKQKARAFGYELTEIKLINENVVPV